MLSTPPWLVNAVGKMGEPARKIIDYFHLEFDLRDQAGEFVGPAFCAVKKILI